MLLNIAGVDANLQEGKENTLTRPTKNIAFLIHMENR